MVYRFYCMALFHSQTQPGIQGKLPLTIPSVGIVISLCIFYVEIKIHERKLEVFKIRI